MCFVFKQQTAYEMRISDWSSDVCSSDLLPTKDGRNAVEDPPSGLRLSAPCLDGSAAHPVSPGPHKQPRRASAVHRPAHVTISASDQREWPKQRIPALKGGGYRCGDQARSEEHTSELQSLMRISYAVFCLKKKQQIRIRNIATQVS